LSFRGLTIQTKTANTGMRMHMNSHYFLNMLDSLEKRNTFVYCFCYRVQMLREQLEFIHGIYIYTRFWYGRWRQEMYYWCKYQLLLQKGAHDPFLESSSSGTFKAKRLESQIFF